MGGGGWLWVGRVLGVLLWVVGFGGLNMEGHADCRGVTGWRFGFTLNSLKHWPKLKFQLVIRL